MNYINQFIIFSKRVLSEVRILSVKSQAETQDRYEL